MHNNYHFIKKLSLELSERLAGYRFLECFSQNKDELVIGLSKGEADYFIRASLQGDFCCLSFPEDYRRAKRNSVDLFQDLIGKTVSGVRQFENERSFGLEFQTGETLLFKMHGNRSNILLFEGGELKDVFKSHLKSDWDTQLAAMDRPIEQSFEAFQKAEGDWMALYPTLGKYVKKYFLASGWDGMSLEARWDLLRETVAKLEEGKFFLVRKDTAIYLTLLEEEGAERLSDVPTEAVSAFYGVYTREYYLNKERTEAVRQLQSNMAKTRSYIQKTEKKFEKLVEGVKFNEVADVIMANLHTIPKHVKEVELFNFYTNENLKIRLKPELSPQLNAQNYYRKAKNQAIEIDNLEKNLDQKENELKQQGELLTKIEQVESVRELRKLLKKDQTAQKQNKPNLPYFSFRYKEFDVWVGKNPKSNDLMMQKFAYKEDMWLHAKDVPGSHILIKHQANRVFPKDVIEYAAGSAAYYSKRKSDSLCPVTVTPRKYIRKQKGAAAGKVLIDKEEVIMVPPRRP